MSFQETDQKKKAGAAGGRATARRHPDRAYQKAGTRGLLKKLPEGEERSAYFRELGRKGAASTNDPATPQRLIEIGRLVLSAFETEDDACPE